MPDTCTHVHGITCSVNILFLHIDDLMIWFTGDVKARYYHMKHEREMDLWPPVKADLYPAEALAYRTHQSHDVAKQPIHLYEKDRNIEQIFDPISGKNPRTVLIEGYPGVGKTTLVKEICIKWAEGLTLTSNKLVLLLLLGDPNVQKITTMQQLIEHFAKSTSMVKQVFSYVEAQRGAGITFILDGFDEMSNKVQSRYFFTALIEGKVLPLATIVLTSRPHALGYFKSDKDEAPVLMNLNEVVYDFAQNRPASFYNNAVQKSPSNPNISTAKKKTAVIFPKSELTVSGNIHGDVDKIIEIFGFKQSSINQYAMDVLRYYADSLKNLQKHLQQYSHINVMCHNPAIMSMMVFICKCQSNDLPSTTSEMYANYIVCVIVNYINKPRKTHTTSICSRFKYLSQEMAHKVVQQLVFDKSGIKFDAEKLKDVPENMPKRIADISKPEELLKETIYEVLQHLGKLAFEALMYGKTVFVIEELFPICKDDPSCFGLLRAIESSGTGKGDILFNFLNLGMQEYFAAKYLSSLSDDEIYTLLNESFLTTDITSSNLSNMWIMYCGIVGEQCNHKVPNIMLAFLSSLLSNNKWPRLSLYNLRQYLQSVSSLPLLKKYTSMTEDKLTSLNHEWMSHMHKLTPLLALYLYQCFREAGDEKLSEVVADSFDGYVDLNGCRLLPHHLAYLGFFLSNLRSKEWAELNLYGCHVGDHGIHILYQGMKAWNTKIRTVDLRDNSLTEASSQIIGSLPLQPLHLVLSRNEIPMVKNMHFKRKVKVLHLAGINCKIPDIELISGMVTFLEELDISYNGLGDDGVTLLSKGIAKTGTLKVLNINNNNIGPSGCVAIKDALIKNTSLVELRVGNN